MGLALPIVTLLDRLIQRIDREGPLPFEEFMAACLYDPKGGFFGSGPLRSVKSGDFLTSPEVSPWFGRTLASWVADIRGSFGGPAFSIAEIGAGSGSLLEPLLATLDPTPDEVFAVEASPAARSEILRRLPAVRVLDDLDGIPQRFTGAVIANELADNLPVSIAVRTEQGWEERYVGSGDGGLTLVGAPARAEVADWATAFCGDVRPGGLVEVQIEAGRWLSRLASRVERGAILLIDYGGTAEELEPRRTQGTLRTYRAHHLGPDPLLEPGATDVTSDVNFTALLASVEGLGFRARLLRQDDFLSEFGLRRRISEIRHRERELARNGDPMERLRLRSEATDAETLLHPRGLGDFRVLELVRNREP